MGPFTGAVWLKLKPKNESVWHNGLEKTEVATVETEHDERCQYL